MTHAAPISAPPHIHSKITPQRNSCTKLSECERARSRVPQQFHEPSVLSAPGKAWQGNERDWRRGVGSRLQVDLIDMKTWRRLQGGSKEGVDFSVEQLTEIVRKDHSRDELMSF
jgi:hypothetical protein